MYKFNGKKYNFLDFSYYKIHHNNVLPHVLLYTLSKY